jgi:hypothetical protein
MSYLSSLSPLVRTPFKTSLVASGGVFLATLIGFTFFHHDSFNDHVLTPIEEMPGALLLAAVAGALSLLGTWLGLRHSHPHRLTYRLGLGIAVTYVIATWLANTLASGPAKAVVVPSREFYIHEIHALLIGVTWGICAPYLIAVLLKRLKLFATSGG